MSVGNRVLVRAPATSANLGPGFDVLALTLDIEMQVTGQSTPGDQLRIANADGVFEADQSNLIGSTYHRACDELEVAAEARGVDIACRSDIPMARGLGSSAAAALAGVLLAEALHAPSQRWSADDLVALVTEFEGHPDNAAAAVAGGFTICVEGRMRARHDLPDDLVAVLFIPDTEVSTAAARAVVPESFSRSDAIANLGRCALLVHALQSRDYASLATAMQDSWHQPYRAALMPAMPELIAAALTGGARGAALSGAGPTIIALTDGASQPVLDALNECAARLGVNGAARTCALRNYGARVEVLERRDANEARA